MVFTVAIVTQTQTSLFFIALRQFTIKISLHLACQFPESLVTTIYLPMLPAGTSSLTG